MNRELAMAAKKYNFLENLQIGTYLDAKDSNQWKVAKIVEIKNYGHRHIITLHFDGYPKSWDQNYELPSSSKLAPFRKFTLPFTGPSERPVYRPLITLNTQTNLPVLQKIIKENKNNLKPEWIIQNIRGELFILIDTLLTQNLRMRPQQYEDHLNFFEKFIEASIHIINFAIERISEINTEIITDPNVIYVSPQHALVSSLPEILFSLNSLVTTKQKRIKFYSTFESMGDAPRKRIKNFLIRKDIMKLCKIILEGQTTQGKGFPWSTKKQAFVLLTSFDDNFQFPKILDQKQMSEALDVLHSLKTVINQDSLQSIRLELICSHITLGNFEGKMKGLNQLRKIIDNSLYFKKHLLKEKILNANLLNTLTDNSTFNAEIFKRSLPFFEAAYKQNLLNDEIFKKILSLYQDKHELELKSYYATLAQFGQFLNEKKAVQFFHEFEQFPLDLQKIGLIKDYTLNVVGKNMFYRRKSDETGFGFGFQWFLSIIKDTKNSQQIINSAIEALATIGKEYYFEKSISVCFQECFNNIRQGKNIETSLKIMHTCINKNAKLTVFVGKIDKQFSVVDSVMKPLIEAQTISKKLIEIAFSFLEQVNKSIQKGLTVEHIKNLWKIKQCRTGLLKFMRKYETSRGQEKENQKILSIRLNSQDIKEIITKIFMNKVLMDNYQDISEEAYETMDQLLLCFNHRSRNVDYNPKKTIRCMNMNGLFGLQLYLEVGINAKNQNISIRSLTRFIEYHLRPHLRTNNLNTQYQEKLKLWLLCTEKITKIFAESPKKFVAFSILFEQIKGRMRSLNIFEETISTFSVQHRNLQKNLKTKRIFNVPKYFSLWKLRHIISQEFKIGHINFQMADPNGRPYDMERQEDYSIAFVDTFRDHNTISIYVTEKNQKHPHTVAIEQFKACFSHTYGQLCYQSLGTLTNTSDQLLSLQILKCLPEIKSIQQKFLKLDIGKQSAWEQILDKQSKPKLIYQLCIINKVKQTNDWMMNFIKKRGIQHIQKILREKNKNLNKKSLTITDYKALLELMLFFNEAIRQNRRIQKLLCFNEESLIEFIKVPSYDKNNKELLQSTSFLDYQISAFQNFNEALNYPQVNGAKILEDHRVQQILEILLFTPVKTEKQNIFPKTLEQIIGKSKGELIISNFIEGYFDKFFQNPKMKQSCQVFFDVLVILFDKNLVTHNLFCKVLQFIKKVRFSQANIIFLEKNGQTNELINGWLRITKCLLLKKILSKEKWEQIPEPEQKFANFLIIEGLFKQGHLFQSQKCRNQAFEILSHLSCSKQIMSKISNEINPILVKASWRKPLEWFVKSSKKRQQQACVGLKNLAATCYINSLLQQLFYIKEFSEALLAVDTKKIEMKQNVAYELQKIFAFLKHSNREVFTTETLCMNFIVQGEPIDPRVQMDVDQFFHTLLEKLEQNLMKINKQDIIDNVFRGEYSNLIIGQQCGHKSERVQHFMSMRLEIINKSSLTQALAEHIKGEMLEGQNAYFCQKCDKKVKALKRVCVKSLPNILILTLKRFEFNFELMEKFKLNSFCQFDEELDMSPYMRETLYENQEKINNSKYKYRLKGVIIHYGISEAGHYTSYIKLENNKWKYFDDDKISDFDFKDFGQQCFGGREKNSDNDNSERIKNAYILIYEKVEKQKAQRTIIDSFIKSEVDAQNLNNEKIQILFNPELQNFYHHNALALGKSYLIYTHIVSLRSEQRQKLLKRCYEMCVFIFESDNGHIDWYLNNFSESLIKEFIIHGFYQASFFVASLLEFCVKKRFNPDFIRRCMKCLERKHMVPLNKVFQAAQKNPDYCKIMVSEQGFFDKIMAIIKQEKYGGTEILSGMTPISSEFGEPASPYYVQRKDFKNSIELIKCIQNFNVKSVVFNDVQSLLKRAKKLSVQNSLAIFLANRFRSEEDFMLFTNKWIYLLLCRYDPSPEDEYLFRLAIILVQKFCLIKDNLTPIRNKKLAEIYANAIKDSLGGYKALKYLLEGLFSISFNNSIFRQEMLGLFNKQFKKYIKPIRDWMKESQKFKRKIQEDELSYWRSGKRNAFKIHQRVENDILVKPTVYLDNFNTLIQGHSRQFRNLLQPQVKIGEVVSLKYTLNLLSDHEEYENEVIDKIGLILHIRTDEGIQKYVLEDDGLPRRSV